MQRVKSRAPPNYMPQVTDTEKRLNILFDHLNNGDLLRQDTILSMTELAQALQSRSYEHAQALQEDISKTHMDELGYWMVSLLQIVPPAQTVKLIGFLQVGVKRLISMSRVTP